MALVIVLCALVLMAGLIVAFFVSVSTERVAATSHSQSNDARKLADSALNIVVAQIKDATTSVNADGLPTSWASQPGLIRTFAADGTPSAAYKLYSASALRDTSGLFDPASTDATKNDVIDPAWYRKPALYSDLNAPVYVPDAGGAITIKDPDGTDKTYTSSYPVLDPGAGTANGIGVKGFSIAGSAPLEAGTSNLNPNAAPMPVQWLYVLQDGSVAPPTAGASNSTVTVASATAKNPIIGRIAYWTDDETCKVNINTAAGDLWNDIADLGSYCDMPVANNALETGGTNSLRACQPTLHEYQRYPGHPATTYLSAVFPTVLTARNMIYDIIPRVSSDPAGTLSSVGGTRTTLTATTNLPQSDSDHLYATVDELNFVVSSASLKGTTPRPANLFTPNQVKQAKFFLTAQSRAPELNLFSKPRIGMWPELADATKRTVFDKTIAFCSTIAKTPYYFVRADPVSPTADYASQPRNQALYTYLSNLTSKSIPGYGGDFVTKYAGDRDQILTEIFDYIRSGINLVDGTPGATAYAGPFLKDMKNWSMGGPGQVIPIQIGTTMGFGRTETLLEPLLHIISTETDIDPAAVAFYDKYDSTQASLAPDGVLKGVATKSHGESADKARLITKKVQVAILFSSMSVAHGPSRFSPNLFFEVSGLNNLKLDGQTLDFGGDTQSTTYGTHTPNHEYAWGSFSTFANLFWQRVPLYTPAIPKTWGTDPKTQYPFISKSILLNSGNGVEVKTPLSLSSGSTPLKLKIYAADLNGVKKELVQTISFKFPDTTVPAPQMASNYTITYNTTSPYYNDSPTVRSVSTTDDTYIPASPDAYTWLYNNYGDLSYDNKSIIRSVTRGLGAGGVKGDVRLVAATQNVTDDYFTPLPGYSSQSAKITPVSVVAGAPPPPNYKYDYRYQLSLDTPTAPNSDGMVCGSDRIGNGGGDLTFAGDLVSGVTYDKHKSAGNTNYGPAVSWGTTAATLTGTNGKDAPGDWDNGMGSIPDGPFINKADEGEIGSSAYSSYTYSGSNATTFSPNRQVPSPVIFGSLSTGVIAKKPWQTLLFCPNPPAGKVHPGFGTATDGSTGPTVQGPYKTPPDHLLLDLFDMPVVEPYAISEPFSTAGKINLNYQIAPFNYIKRSTGLQAVLRSTRVMAIPTTDGLSYKSGTQNANPYRMNIDLDKTLLAFDDRFAKNQPFRSASEICQMYLVPQAPFPGSFLYIHGTTAASIDTSMTSWWSDYKLTGDNMRERPYAQIYSRLTTKSNSYTVHVRVQALKKVTTDPTQGQWVEGKDQVVAEYRGSFGIERFIDPNDPDLQTKFDENYFGADEMDPTSGAIKRSGRVDPFYRFRVVSTKQFSP